jgi:hypothetical protein
LETHTPLWLYVLAEAEITSNGEKLGPFAGRLVLEVFHALIEASPVSILDAPDWRSQLPSQTSSRFTLADLVAFAGLNIGR